MQEVLTNQETRFTCESRGRVEWELQYYNKDNMVTTLLAICNTTCHAMNTFDELFTISVLNNHTTAMIIKARNNTKVYNNVQLVNGSLECKRTNDNKMKDVCGLHLIDPPQNVSCTAVNTSWSVNVSCVITSVYSSRRIYQCHLLRNKNASQNNLLENATMGTSSTNEKITKNEVKVSGFCQFNTTLPTEEGNYSFYVSVSPGGQSLSVQDMLFAVERPTSPDVSCDLQPYVLENTTVTCTCKTTSLGQPAGYLRWITGNETAQEGTVTDRQNFPSSQELHYTQLLTLSDHGKFWLRCDIMWGPAKIQGQNYSANVGYAPKMSRLFLNDHEQNATVEETDEVHLRCESDGRPTPDITIYNNGNDSVVVTGSSVTNYSFIARCEHTATYTCSARNEFSGHVKTSLTLQLDVGCKPQSKSSTADAKIKVKDERDEVNFDVIAFPAPTGCGVWFSSNESSHFQKIDANVSCKSDREHRYIFRCTLTVCNNTYPCQTGMYTVQLTNEHGDGNFTFQISFDEEIIVSQENHFTVLGFAAGSFLLILLIAVLILVIRKRMKDSSRFRRASSTNLSYDNSGSEEDHERRQAAEIIYEIPWDSVPLRMEALNRMTTPGSSQPAPCETPLYAVVDKKRKKTNTRPVHIAEERGCMAMNINNSTQGVSGVSESGVAEFGYRRDIEEVYAVVDKVKVKTKSNRGQGQRTETHRCRQRKNDHYEEDQVTEDPVYLNNIGTKFKKKDHPTAAQTNVVGKKNLPSPASSSQTVDNGRWENDDGLIYVTPFFDVSDDLRRPPPLRQEEAEYCTLRLIQNKLPASDSDSDH